MRKTKIIKTENLIQKLDERFLDLHQRYKDLHVQFDTFRGKVTKKDDAPKIVDIMDQIGKTYKELNTIMNFVHHRYKTSAEINHHFNAFTAEMQEATKIIGKL